MLTEDNPKAGRPQRAIRTALVWVAISAGITVTFAAGYRAGAARQERRLLDEFLVNATRLGILDVERLRVLVEAGGTNAIDDAASDEVVPGGH